MEIINNLYQIVALICIELSGLRFVETGDNFRKLVCAVLFLGTIIFPIISNLAIFLFGFEKNRAEVLKNTLIANLIGIFAIVVYVYVWFAVHQFICDFAPVGACASPVPLADYIVFFLSHILIVQIFSQFPIFIKIFSLNRPEDYKKFLKFKYVLLIVLVFLIAKFEAPDVISQVQTFLFTWSFIMLGIFISRNSKNTTEI